MDRFLRVLNIQPQETKLVSALFFFSFAIGAAKVFELTASQALFLENYNAGDLSYVYMIASVATIATSWGYLRLGAHVSLQRIIFVNLWFSLVVSALLWLALTFTSARWPSMALIVWYQVLIALTNVAFWSAATQVVDIRQGKRLFPVLTTGGVLAASLGGLFILPTVRWIGTENLVLIGVVWLGLSIFSFRWVTSLEPTNFELISDRDEDGREESKVDWNSPYLRLMMAYFIISAVVFVFLDNAFLDVAQVRFTDTESLARFFATYSAVAAIVTFLFRSLGAGQLVERFGLIAGLLGLPLALLIGSGSVAMSGVVIGGLGVIFWLTTMTRLFDRVFRGMQQTSFATLYQPLMEKGPAVQTTLDGIIDSAALGVAGLALLLLHRFFEISALQLAFMLAAMCAVWVVVTFALRREYVKVLGRVLQGRRIQGQPLYMMDGDVLELVRHELESDHYENVIYAVQLLEEADFGELDEILIKLLQHDSDDVLFEVLARIESRDVVAALPGVREIIQDGEGSEPLRGRAVRVAAALSEEIYPEVMEALHATSPSLRRGALVGLLKSGSIEGIVYAGAELLEDLRSSMAQDRIFAANVLRDAEIPSFYRQAIQLLNDRDKRVRSAAVEAAARMAHPPLWPLVVDALRDPDLAAVASEALINAGEAGVPSLLYGFERHTDDTTFRITVLRILGQIASDDAVEYLADVAYSKHRDIRHAALRAAAQCNLPLGGERKQGLRGQLRDEVKEAGELFVAREDLMVTLRGDPVVRALKEEVERAQHRIFLTLKLLLPREDVLQTWDSFSSGDRYRRAYALELLENWISNEDRAWIYPVLEDLPGPERMSRIGRTQTIHRMSWKDRVRWVIGESGLSTWTQVCARQAAQSHDLDVSEPTSAETEIFQRALRLRKVDLFEEMDDHVLAALAPRLQSVELQAGEPVFEQGETGDCMYLVMDGRVHVHTDSQSLAYLEANTVFGEFTVLHSGARTASVTAETETSLLRFSQEDLYDVLSERISVARALIRMIVKRLRENLATRAETNGA